MEIPTLGLEGAKPFRAGLPPRSAAIYAREALAAGGRGGRKGNAKGCVACVLGWVCVLGSCMGPRALGGVLLPVSYAFKPYQTQVGSALRADSAECY